MNAIRLLIATLFTLSSLILWSQKRIAVVALDVVEKKSSGLSIFGSGPSSTSTGISVNVPQYCLNFLANNKKFITVDRQNLSLINAEKELQKSENFIDGYIVSQGKSEGVDYILKPIYFKEKEMLTLRMYDISGNSIKCFVENKLDVNFFQVKNLEAQTQYMMHELLLNCFDVKYSIVRPADDKEKKYLVAIGKRQLAVEGDKVSIFEMVEEEIDGEKIVRRNELGRGVIDKVQDDNFSLLSFRTNEKIVREALKSGKKLYVTIINVFD
jgi:hypothetical protein